MRSVSGDKDTDHSCRILQGIHVAEDINKRKTDLASKILAFDSIKHDSEYPRQIREKAEDESARCYDELLKLCNGDAQVVAFLIGQKDWFKEQKAKHI